MPYTVGSLFAGIGGVCLGFQQASIGNGENDNYQLTWANEIDEYPAITYRHNFRHHPLIVGDIEKIVNPDRCETNEEREEYIRKQNDILTHPIDVLTGGFPCQAFSIAGARRGFDDHRGNLFWSIIDLVNLHINQHGVQPRVLFLENVKNLLTHDNGHTYEVIQTQLENIGYTVKKAVLNTMNYSQVPQNRERLFIACFLEEEVANNFTLFDENEDGVMQNLLNARIDFTPEERTEQIIEIIDTLDINNPIHERYFYTQARYPHYFLSEEEYLAIPEDERRDIRINLNESITEHNQFYQLRRGMYVRRNMNNVCPTLTANMGTGGHNCPLILDNDGIRKITPEEAFKLQGFPIGDGYSISNENGNRICSDGRLYKQAGNAVSVPVIRFIATHILEALREFDENN